MGSCCSNNDVLEISKTSEISVDEILEISQIDENIFDKLREDTFGTIKTNIIIH